MLRPLVLVLAILAASAALADSPAAPRISVPRAQKTPVIDGSVASAEWARGARVFFGDAGHALLLHDGQYLYIALVAVRPAVGSICTSSKAGRVSVLHSSGTLGAARYEKNGAKWDLTRPFTMTRPAGTEEAKKFVETEGWFSSTNPMAVRQREFQIRIGNRTEIPLVLSLLTFVSRTAYDLDAWPSTVYDGCVELSLAGGSTEGTYTFDPESWGVAVLGK